MECKGVDIFLIHKGIPPLPKEAGKFKLELVSNRGTSFSIDGGDPGFLLVDWHRCRYIADEVVDDGDIQVLLQAMSKVGTWEKAQKLFWENGERQFSKAH